MGITKDLLLEIHHIELEIEQIGDAEDDAPELAPLIARRDELKAQLAKWNAKLDRLK